MRAQNLRIGIRQHPVEDVDPENEVVEISDRAENRLGDDVKRKNVIGDAAAEQHFVLPTHSRIVREAPQQDEDIGDEQQEVAELLGDAPMPLKVRVNALAQAI